MDIRNIGYGDNFVTAIDKALGDAEVAVRLAVISRPRWWPMSRLLESLQRANS
jgi:hypothetical protein